MFNKTKLSYYKLGAALSVGLFMGSAGSAHANNFGNIVENLIGSIYTFSGMISAMAYLIAILLMVLGLMKIKDHVENPTQTPLKDGVARLVIGGALIALTIISEAAFETIGQGDAFGPAELKGVSFNVT